MRPSCFLAAARLCTLPLPSRAESPAPPPTAPAPATAEALGADLPRFWGGRIRGQAGLELAALLVKHGGGFPTETISFASGRHYIDLVNFALFLRVEYGTEG